MQKLFEAWCPCHQQMAGGGWRLAAASDRDSKCFVSLECEPRIGKYKCRAHGLSSMVGRPLPGASLFKQTGCFTYNDQWTQNATLCRTNAVMLAWISSWDSMTHGWRLLESHFRSCLTNSNAKIKKFMFDLNLDWFWCGQGCLCFSLCSSHSSSSTSLSTPSCRCGLCCCFMSRWLYIFGCCSTCLCSYSWNRSSGWLYPVPAIFCGFLCPFDWFLLPHTFVSSTHFMVWLVWNVSSLLLVGTLDRELPLGAAWTLCALHCIAKICEHNILSNRFNRSTSEKHTEPLEEV